MSEFKAAAVARGAAVMQGWRENQCMYNRKRRCDWKIYDVSVRKVEHPDSWHNLLQLNEQTSNVNRLRWKRSWHARMPAIVYQVHLILL